MSRVVWINCVGLTPAQIGAETPNLSALARDGFSAPMTTVLPAVTCSAQSTLLTGRLPSSHGIVGNGWYFRDLGEVWFWRQSNALVQGDKIWHEARRADPSFTVCNLFWWYAMNADVDALVTPRPVYCADGRKLPGIYGLPLEFRAAVESELPPFPLFQFWGPGAGLESSQWIIDAARLALDRLDSTLLLVYVPHLDYDFQRHGPDDPRSRQALCDVDRALGPLIDAARARGRRVVVSSEYAIGSVRAPVHLNRALRMEGLLAVTPNLDRELLDPHASRAFAVADHQIAHVYVRNLEDHDRVRRVLAEVDGVAAVLDAEGKRRFGLDHERSGEFVVLAERDRWFSYYYWLDEERAPDFAPTVEIHRKPGYDPAELFIDPAIAFAKPRILLKLARKKLGFRMLMDVIPTHGDLVRGSHGLLPTVEAEGPVLISDAPPFVDGTVPMTAVKDWVLRLLAAEN